MNEIVIEARGICKSYRDSRNRLEVLKNVELRVGKGEFVVIQGPSGAGKSTLLHILAGLDDPTGGSVLFGGTDIYALDENSRSVFRNRKVGFVFQFFHLLPELTALENVMLPGLFKSFWGRGNKRESARCLLERLGLSRRLGHKPQELSGGEQQRVAIARALINSSQILLCDEPTGNLDSENGANILGLIEELNKKEGITVVMATHDKEIAGAAGRLVHLKDGVILN